MRRPHARSARLHGVCARSPPSEPSHCSIRGCRLLEAHLHRGNIAPLRPLRDVTAFLRLRVESLEYDGKIGGNGAAGARASRDGLLLFWRFALQRLGMRLCHAAVPVLVGWYLLMMPASNLRESTSEIPPLRKWELVRSFDSADGCTANMYQIRREQWAALAKYGIHTVDEIDTVLADHRKPPPESEVTAIIECTRKLTSECIASDDPRLKEK